MDFNSSSGRASQQQPSGNQQAFPPYQGTAERMSQGGTMQQLYARQQMMQGPQTGTAPGASAPGAQAQPQATQPAAVPSVVPPVANPSNVRQEQRRQLNPPPFPPEYFDDLSKHSIGALCVIGKELVQELTIRSATLFSLLKQEKQTAQDPQVYIEYNTKLFNQLAQIRILIDERISGKEKRLAELYEDLQNMDDPEPPSKPAQLVELEAQFKENKKKLTELVCDLKLLDWTASVSDPGHLKRVDKMQTARDPTYY